LSGGKPCTGFSRKQGVRRGEDTASTIESGCCQGNWCRRIQSPVRRASSDGRV